MKIRITERSKLGAAYAMGRFRQQINLSIALFFINLMILMIMKGDVIAFNIAILIISAIAFWANRASIKKLEEQYALTEESLEEYKKELV